MQEYLKAFTSAIVIALGATELALTDGHVSWLEGCKIAIAGLTAFGAVWAVPNATKSAVVSARKKRAQKKAALWAAKAKG